jgi:sulfur-carrier protein adenylyltransferase/sulfurtransferase
MHINSNILSAPELNRYDRHLILPEIGLEGQQKLKAAKVLVIGCGGLGSPLLQYLTAAGVGTIGVLDFDVVDESNLQRQVLFSVKDIGKPKAEVAIEKLKEQNPFVKFVLHHTKLRSENALEILKDYDIIADGTDNFPTRYLVNDACVLLGKTNVFASVNRFEGQVSVFNYSPKNGERGPDYRDLFPHPPAPETVQNCAEAGVLGVLPGIIGSIQANEVIKIITGAGEPLSGKLFLLNSLSMETNIIQFTKDNTRNPIEKLIDYDLFCSSSGIKEITVTEFVHWKEKKDDFQLVDVRESFEYETANIGGLHIPLAELEKRISEIEKNKKVVIHCRSGNRSKQAIQLLEKKFGYNNLYNLKGGIMACMERTHNFSG